jgi:5-methylcytosine-specific restriction endonuclease McrA
MKGKKMSADSRAKMSEAARARPSNRTGKPHTIETRKKISERTRECTPKGSECHGFVDGNGAQRQGERITMELKRWRFEVYVRDDFSCKHCGDNRGGNLNAHHIKPWAANPELRFNLDNGITLCVACHWLAHRVDIPGLG